MLAFRNIIYNTRTYVYTDNANITYDTSAQTTRAQIWKLILAEFDFVLVHVKGKDNCASDFLSRHEKNKKEEKNLLLTSFNKTNILKNHNKELLTTVRPDLLINFSPQFIAAEQQKANKVVEFQQNKHVTKHLLIDIENLINDKERVVVPEVLWIKSSQVFTKSLSTLANQKHIILYVSILHSKT